MARLVPADGGSGAGGALFLEDFSEASFAVDMYLRVTDEALDGGKEEANEARERWLLGRLASAGEFEVNGTEGYYAQSAGIASDSTSNSATAMSNSNGSSSNDDDDYVDGDDDDSEDSASLFYAGLGAEAESTRGRAPAIFGIPVAEVDVAAAAVFGEELHADSASPDAYFGTTSDSGDMSDSSAASLSYSAPSPPRAAAATASKMAVPLVMPTVRGHARQPAAGKAGALPRPSAPVDVGAMALTDTDLVALDIAEIQRLSGMQLTKAEERALKRLRRRVKNKLSAASSRQKKRDYLSGLEERVELVTAENHTLKARIAQLEAENRALRTSAPAAATARATTPAALLVDIPWQATVTPTGRARTGVAAVASASAAARPATQQRRAVGAVLMVVLLSFGFFFQWTAAPSNSAGGVAPSGAKPAAGQKAPLSTYTGRRLLDLDAADDASAVLPPYSYRIDNYTSQVVDDVLEVQDVLDEEHCPWGGAIAKVRHWAGYAVLSNK